MVTRTLRPKQPVWLGTGGLNDTLNPMHLPVNADPSTVAGYSGTLVTLINDCLAFDPNQRPSVAELRDRINAAIADGPNDPNLGDDMRGVMAGPAIRARNTIATPINVYAVGLARAALPAQDDIGA